MYRFTRDWEGQTAVFIGNGLSVLDVDLTRLRDTDYRVMVTNGGFQLYPLADQLMCSDKHYLGSDPPFHEYLGPQIVVTQPQAVVRRDPRMVFVKRAYIDSIKGDIFKDPGTLVEGHTSTATSLSAATLRGVGRILLLGVDLRPGPDMRRRATDDRVGNLPDIAHRAQARYALMNRHLAAQAEHILRRNIQVINCSPDSALSCYPKGRLEDYL